MWRSEAREQALVRRLQIFPVLAERGRVEIRREPSTMRGPLVVAVSVVEVAATFLDALGASMKEIMLVV